MNKATSLVSCALKLTHQDTHARTHARTHTHTHTHILPLISMFKLIHVYLLAVFILLFSTQTKYMSYLTQQTMKTMLSREPALITLLHAQSGCNMIATTTCCSKSNHHIPSLPFYMTLYDDDEFRFNDASTLHRSFASKWYINTVWF